MIGHPASGAALAGARAAPWALLAFIGVLAASAAAELTGDIRWDVATAGLFLLGLAQGWRHWLPRASGRVAIFTATAVLLVGALLSHDPRPIAVAAAPMARVVVLILAIALMRPVFAHRQLDQSLAALLARAPALLRPLVILLASAVGSLGLSFGAVGVLGATLGRRAAPQQDAACASMRGLVLSMLIGPSTASVAAVMATYPDIGWGASLMVGAPLALAGAVLGAVIARPIAIEAGERHNGRTLIAGALIGLELLAALLTHLVFGLSMTLAISVASASVALGCMIYWGRDDIANALERADTHLQERWQAAMPETALFLACGLLVGVMQIPVIAEAAKALVAASLPGGLWGVGVLLFALPLVAVAGIHPMVPFAVLSPVVSAAALGITPAGLYAMWIVMFMLSMLLSPVSILTMITTANFNIAGRLLGLRGNGLYAAAMAGASTLLIGLLCGA